MKERKKLKSFWDKLFGYHLGQRVKLEYRTPLKIQGFTMGVTILKVEGTILEINKAEIRLKNVKDIPEGCTLTLKRNRIVP